MKEKGRDEKRLSIFESTVFSTILPSPPSLSKKGDILKVALMDDREGAETEVLLRD